MTDKEKQSTKVDRTALTHPNDTCYLESDFSYRSFFLFYRILKKHLLSSNTILTISICGLLLSCSQPGSNIINQKTYFDLTGFFDQQVSLLYRDSLVGIKTSQINGVSDQHLMPWTDWKKEFALFYGSEINKISFIGKYSTDTVYNPGNDSSLTEVIYKAKDSNLRTRKMEVVFDRSNKDVKSIHIINHALNFLSGSDEELLYIALKGYIIKTRTNMKLFGEDDFAVKGEIVSKKNSFKESID